MAHSSSPRAPRWDRRPQLGRAGRIGISLVVALQLFGSASSATRASTKPAAPVKITDCTDDNQLWTDVTKGGSYVFACSGQIPLEPLAPLGGSLHYGPFPVRATVTLNANGQSVTIESESGMFDVRARLPHVAGTEAPGRQYGGRHRPFRPCRSTEPEASPITIRLRKASLERRAALAPPPMAWHGAGACTSLEGQR